MYILLLATTLSAQLPPEPVPDPCLDLAFHAGAAAEERERGTPMREVMERDIAVAEDRMDLEVRLAGLRIGYATTSDPDTVARLTYMTCIKKVQ